MLPLILTIGAGALGLRRALQGRPADVEALLASERKLKEQLQAAQRRLEEAANNSGVDLEKVTELEAQVERLKAEEEALRTAKEELERAKEALESAAGAQQEHRVALQQEVKLLEGSKQCAESTSQKAAASLTQLQQDIARLITEFASGALSGEDLCESLTQKGVPLKLDMGTGLPALQPRPAIDGRQSSTASSSAATAHFLSQLRSMSDAPEHTARLLMLSHRGPKPSSFPSLRSPGQSKGSQPSFQLPFTPRLALSTATQSPRGKENLSLQAAPPASPPRSSAPREALSPKPSIEQRRVEAGSLVFTRVKGGNPRRGAAALVPALKLKPLLGSQPEAQRAFTSEAECNSPRSSALVRQ